MFASKPENLHSCLKRKCSLLILHVIARKDEVCKTKEADLR